MTPFRDRAAAGEELASALQELGLADPVVLGLPRGGVAVAAVVAHQLHAPLDAVLVRKVGAPGQPEFALAAIGENGVLARNEEGLISLGIDENLLAALASAERDVLEQRVRAIRAIRAQEPVQGRDAVVVDDGIATGATIRAACQVLRPRSPRRLIVAAPVASAESLELLAGVADEIVCVERPPAHHFGGVGRFYRDFSPVPDATVLELLRKE